VNPIEEEAIKQYEALGYDVIKNGIPDLICVKKGKILFVECKSKTDTLRRNQKEAIKILRSKGFIVRIEGEGAERARRDYLNYKYGWIQAMVRMKR